MLLLFCISLAAASVTMRVMTFNIWLSGAEVENGLQKIAKHILLVDPDIVALQEVKTQYVITNLTTMLSFQSGHTWSGIWDKNLSYPDVGILTKHNLHPHSFARTNWSIGVKISLHTGQYVNFWSAHLDYIAYGPYAANNKMVSTNKQIMAGEHPTQRPGRYQNAIEIQQNERMQQWINKSDIIPVIFAGDFNCPSHLDWVESTKHLHAGWVFEWPATKILADMGFKDTFRIIHPDPIVEPGHTWSTVNKFNAEWEYTIPEPQDRIDFILYQGNARPINSFTYSGYEQLTPIPNHWKNDYPSDHFAVVTEFFLNY